MTHVDKGCNAFPDINDSDPSTKRKGVYTDHDYCKNIQMACHCVVRLLYFEEKFRSSGEKSDFHENQSVTIPRNEKLVHDKCESLKGKNIAYTVNKVSSVGSMRSIIFGTESGRSYNYDRIAKQISNICG